jgi:hypothetical protein
MTEAFAVPRLGGRFALGFLTLEIIPVVDPYRCCARLTRERRAARGRAA